MDYLKISEYIKPVFKSPDNTGSWFGYYNYDTLNYNQTKMLSHRTVNDAQKISRGMKVEIGYYDIPSGDWHKVDESDSYSWQQGAMLQWLSGEGNRNKIIFNFSRNNHLMSRIIDIETGEAKDINWPIYCITPDGNKSIALDMERSYWCRAYHYESVVNEELNVRVPENDGIFEVDLVNNARKCLIPIQTIINTDKEPYFDDAKHWLEHIMICPDGTRFCFLHRYTLGKLEDYETRLFIADIDGSHLRIVNGWRSYYWSHFGWNGSSNFAIYTYESEMHHQIVNNYRKALAPHTETERILKEEKNSNGASIKDFARKIVPSILKKKIWNIWFKKPQYYQYYTIQGEKVRLESTFKGNVFSIDGHPSFTKDGNYMITDTYPDSHQYQHLIIYNLKTNKAAVVAKLYAGLHKKPGSCDLHPKLCHDNKYIAVDSAYNGQHHIILFEINWILIKNKIG